MQRFVAGNTIDEAVAAAVEMKGRGFTVTLDRLGEASTGALAAATTMPAWLSPFIDPALWTAVQQAVAGIVASLPAMMPFLGEVAAWLVPAVWVGWGLGFLSLLTLALASTWLLRRSRLPVHHVKAGHLMALWRAFRR